MPYSLRVFTCRDCGQPCKRRAAKGALVRCTACAIAYSEQAARQLHAHQGPIYDKWAWAITSWARRSNLPLAKDGKRSAG